MVSSGTGDTVIVSLAVILIHGGSLSGKWDAAACSTELEVQHLGAAPVKAFDETFKQ